MQDFSAALNAQTPASLSVAANCSPVPHYIETVLSNQLVDFTLFLPKNLDKLPKILPSQTHLARIVRTEMSPNESRTLAIGVMLLLSLRGPYQKRAWKSCYLLISKPAKENPNSGWLNLR